MTVNVVELATVAAELRLEGHLEECDRNDQDWRSCPWCVGAVSVRPLETLLSARHDVQALLHTDAVDSVPWVIAATELQRVIAETTIEIESVRLRSVRSLCHDLRRAMSVDTLRLQALVDRAIAPDGALHRRCDQTAGALAAAAVQHDAHRGTRERLPPVLAAQLERLAATLDSHIQVASLLPWVERSHWHPLPALRTQPEWARRPAPDRQNALQSAQSSTPHLVPGSFESLVVESVIEQVTAELMSLGDRLTHAMEPVAYRRPVEEAPLSAQTRRLVWRIAKIDWHLTFVDSGRANCWNARTEDGWSLIDVPWHVALAIDVTEPHGLVSATHNDRPRRSART